VQTGDLSLSLNNSFYLYLADGSLGQNYADSAFFYIIDAVPIGTSSSSSAASATVASSKTSGATAVPAPKVQAQGLTTEAKAGIAIGVVALVILAAALFYWLYTRRPRPSQLPEQFLEPQQQEVGPQVSEADSVATVHEVSGSEVSLKPFSHETYA
jgi:hypothetical protein